MGYKMFRTSPSRTKLPRREGNPNAQSLFACKLNRIGSGPCPEIHQFAACGNIQQARHFLHRQILESRRVVQFRSALRIEALLLPSAVPAINIFRVFAHLFPPCRANQLISLSRICGPCEPCEELKARVAESEKQTDGLHLEANLLLRSSPANAGVVSYGHRAPRETPITIFAQNEPLKDAEFDRLGEFLKGCAGGKAMNVEELDGFFAALVAGPEVVMPSEYLPKVFGGELSDAHEFGSLEEANEILALLMRHWNDIAATLSKGDVYLPILLEDENGLEHGNDWARGFMRGVEMRREGWAELIADEEHGGCMVPVLMLYHERDPNPEMRPEPIGSEQRETVIEHMAAGLVGAHRYFRQREQSGLNTGAPRPRNIKSKTGRNDPCPCGSGKKYKRCCGGLTIN